MKTLLHGNSIILASENTNERMFIQDFAAMPETIIGKGYWKYKILFKYNKNTESLSITKEKMKDE